MTKTLSEAESKRRLGTWLPLCREEQTRSVAHAVQFMRSAGEDAVFVAKASGVAHKTEGNLVRIGLSAEEVVAQWNELAAAGDGSVLIADFVRADYELLVGATRDPQFGAVLTVGHGGVMTEVLDDAACFLNPLDPADLSRGLAELRCAPLLRGQRGQEPLDLGLLLELGRGVMDTMSTDPEVSEIDLNPVAIVAGRPVVLDALVVLADS